MSRQRSIERHGGKPFWFHAMRNCFISVASRGLLLPESLVKRLVNHRRPAGDVTQDYAADWTLVQLRGPAQRIADRIDELVAANGDPPWEGDVSPGPGLPGAPDPPAFAAAEIKSPSAREGLCIERRRPRYARRALRSLSDQLNLTREPTWKALMSSRSLPGASNE